MTVTPLHFAYPKKLNNAQRAAIQQRYPILKTIPATLTVDDVDTITSLRPAPAGAHQPREVEAPIAYLTIHLPAGEIDAAAATALRGRQPADVEIVDLFLDSDGTFRISLTAQ